MLSITIKTQQNKQIFVWGVGKYKTDRKDVVYIDAPVTGGTEGAKSGTLTIFLGTNKKTQE